MSSRVIVLGEVRLLFHGNFEQFRPVGPLLRSKLVAFRSARVPRASQIS